jgi:hypothetical protein
VAFTELLRQAGLVQGVVVRLKSSAQKITASDVDDHQEESKITVCVISPLTSRLST